MHAQSTDDQAAQRSSSAPAAVSPLPGARKGDDGSGDNEGKGHREAVSNGEVKAAVPAEPKPARRKRGYQAVGEANAWWTENYKEQRRTNSLVQGFALYLKSRRSVYRQQTPDMTPRAVIRLAAKRWKEMSAEGRQEWITKVESKLQKRLFTSYNKVKMLQTDSDDDRPIYTPNFEDDPEPRPPPKTGRRLFENEHVLERRQRCPKSEYKSNKLCWFKEAYNAFSALTPEEKAAWDARAKAGYAEYEQKLMQMYVRTGSADTGESRHAAVQAFVRAQQMEEAAEEAAAADAAEAAAVAAVAAVAAAELDGVGQQQAGWWKGEDSDEG